MRWRWEWRCYFCYSQSHSTGSGGEGCPALAFIACLHCACVPYLSVFALYCFCILAFSMYFHRNVVVLYLHCIYFCCSQVEVVERNILSWCLCLYCICVFFILYLCFIHIVFVFYSYCLCVLFLLYLYCICIVFVLQSSGSGGEGCPVLVGFMFLMASTMTHRYTYNSHNDIDTHI